MRRELCGLLVSAVALVVLSGCGTAEPETAHSGLADESAGGPTASEAADSDDPGHLPVSECAALVASGWKPPSDTHPSIVYDSETGIAQVDFTDPQDAVRVNLREDTRCADLPDLGPLLARTVENLEDAQDKMCASAVEEYRTGEAPAGGEEPSSKEALERYLRTDCDEKYVAMIGEQ